MIANDTAPLEQANGRPVLLTSIQGKNWSPVGDASWLITTGVVQEIPWLTDFVKYRSTFHRVGGPGSMSVVSEYTA